MSGYGGNTLPDIVLVGLDRNESKIGTIFFWVCVPFVIGPIIGYFTTGGTHAERVPALYIAAGFGVLAALFLFISRKRYRVHRSAFAKTLVSDPSKVVAVSAEIQVPKPGGVAHIAVPFDGESEFVPRPEQFSRVLFFKMYPRMWIHVKLEGKLIARKLVVPQHRGGELLSWLFATVAAANPQCAWGERKIADRVGA
ncbi:MAG: hypothetical protein AAGA54_08540 [Myxococcota bacterium]